MKLAVTAMVRDEADIIRQWLDYHVAQGVDVLIVTDNGSTDGTTEILQQYADRGVVDLRHDPVQRKQQGSVVTAMARDAYTQHGADWVVNADADEFLSPLDRSLRLAEVFARLDPAMRSFSVPVVNLVGPIAWYGAGLDRLTWRDERSNEELQGIGVLAQPTHNAVHVGSADVVVAQGNHLVSIGSEGSPPPELALEVLHLPWRSWAQFSHKVDISGRAYEANPELRPSPNHHGMLDYGRHLAGTLLPYYALRHVPEDDAGRGAFRRDPSLREFFATLGDAEYPADERMDDAVAGELARLGRTLRAREADATRTTADLVAAREHSDRLDRRASELERRVSVLEGELARVERELEEFRNRRVVRLADGVGERMRGLRRGQGG
ncbi:glycosyltransferase family 2 protein [Planctomonas psychrotolerans]|uniref:glycosyltransferase family 2 protein n=1 Tax=Planctomonas psychrotolerans TaxID=2528712 RepID=UPI001D0CE4B9|nr:glycosyltransferase family 2 protein [Planctomonas psychrotolerans]